MENDLIYELYQSVIEKPEFREVTLKNSFDISWLKSKLENSEYEQLEDMIFDYGNKNDEILFKEGFRSAWNLFLQCCK